MKTEILKKIKEIEKEENIKIIFLIESGSRAWGWESKDSDFDIRGVFIQDYNKFEKEKEQVNKLLGKLDIELWDLKKFLRLLVKSNPSVWEWLSSDIKYMDNELFTELKNIYGKSFSKYKLERHYLSMAKQNFEKYIDKNRNVNLKKYIYVLRSIACINFIERNKSPPPKNYKDVIEYLPEDIQIFFKKIIKDKINSESEEGNKDREVDNYITSFWNKDFEKDKDSFNVQNLNDIFKKLLKI